jgi:hypothetical protein
MVGIYLILLYIRNWIMSIRIIQITTLGQFYAAMDNIITMKYEINIYLPIARRAFTP